MELEGLSDELLFGDSVAAAAPAPLHASAPVLDLAWHPQQPLLAVGLVTGEVEVYAYDLTTYEITKRPLRNEFAEWVFGRKRLYSERDVVVRYHEHALRAHPTGGVAALEFTDDGAYLVSASSDRSVSVIDCATSRLLIHLAADDDGDGDVARAKTRARAQRSNKTKTAKHTRRAATVDANGTTHNDADDGIVVGTTRVRREGTAALLRTPPALATTTSSTSNDDSTATNAAATPPRRRVRTTATRRVRTTTTAARRNPHKYGISALNICDANLVATGDDDGLIAVWDMRARRTAYVYHEHGDYVTQLCYFTDAHELVSSSGDTCLAVYDTRAGALRDVSERRNDELTCFAFINSSGAGSASFIPSVLCGTPSGSLPLWKYGAWRRPYDVLDRHPRECDALVSFHADDTAFNHNLVLTGAADGLVRVVQMYPLRRNLCQLSARDHDYAHHFYQGGRSSSSSTGEEATSGGGTQRGLQLQQRGGGGGISGRGLSSRTRRGDAAIARMRVSFDCNVLAVCGSDEVIDFVDIRFLNDEKRLDELRNRAEQRHMHVIRVMEREKADEALREAAAAAKADDSDSDSDGDSDSDNDGDSNDNDDEPMTAEDAMAAYKTSRAQKRERVAAAKWLKAEKRKKINFTFEKRRRRVGGFFGDMVATHDDDDDNKDDDDDDDK